MWNEYARTKMLEIDAELARKRPALDASGGPDRRRPLAPVIGAAGRRVRRIGEALESWAQPAQTIGKQRG